MSKIEWTEQTWNVSAGCNKVSQGCKNCYALTLHKRLTKMGATAYQDDFFTFKVNPEALNKPLKRQKPTMYFVNSMSDLFHEKMPFDFLDRVFDTIRATPQHTYQILTKRPERMAEYFKDRKVPDNAWLGTSVENQATKHRILTLRSINAHVLFLSIEPLLEDLGTLENLDWYSEIGILPINWVIVGGESGTGARQMQKDWVLMIKRQCDEKQIPFFFKQWGAYGEDGIKRSKKANGRHLDGIIYDAMPNV